MCKKYIWSLKIITIFITFTGAGYAQESDDFPKVYYPNFCHQVSAISCIGDRIELEDNSVWSVSSDDSHKIFLWTTHDPLVIYPIINIFSSYHYRIKNLITNESISVDLELPPIAGAQNTFQILSIDYFKKEIELSDHSIWKYNSGDYYTCIDWKPGDLIIVGLNEKSFFLSDKFILINANANNYCPVNP